MNNGVTIYRSSPKQPKSQQSSDEQHKNPNFVSSSESKLFHSNKEQFTECLKSGRTIPFLSASKATRVETCMSKYFKRETNLLDVLEGKTQESILPNYNSKFGIHLNNNFLGVQIGPSHVKAGLLTNKIDVGFIAEQDKKIVSPFAVNHETSANGEATHLMSGTNVSASKLETTTQNVKSKSVSGNIENKNLGYKIGGSYSSSEKIEQVFPYRREVCDAITKEKSYLRNTMEDLDKKEDLFEKCISITQQLNHREAKLRTEYL